MLIMKKLIPCLCFCIALCQALPSLGSPFLEDQAKYDLYRTEATATQKAILENRESGCTWNNVIVRKEWSTLSLAARKEYTVAVLCLRKLPPITPPEVAPGARSRFDDLHASHINQTLWIHLSTYFLPWHRYFTHAWEKALRDECGYTGGQPYWEWSAGDSTPGSNALFTEPGSIGGNGESIPHNASLTYVPTVPQIVARGAPGTGGGCILDGPFAGMTNNLGPQGPPTTNNAFEYNPRCIRRDFRPEATNTSLTYPKVINLLSQPDLHTFQSMIEGMHPRGHQGIGGMNDDLYAGNGDPAFYFHHAQVDHMWNLWQTMDRETRLWQVTETLTIANSPPSANGTLDTRMDLGFNGKEYTMRELVSTIDGPFCYIYE